MLRIRQAIVSSLGFAIFCAWMFRDLLRRNRYTEYLYQRITGIVDVLLGRTPTEIELGIQTDKNRESWRNVY